MKTNGLENKITFSFDRGHSANIFFKKPDKFREIEELSKHDGTLINTGSNLSYSPLGFCTDSISINLKKFNRIIDFNLEKKEITVESGITLSQLLNFTLMYNLWIPQLPGYPFITIGGAIATNAHGKSCAMHGTIRNSIKKLKIFHIKNGWLNLSEKEIMIKNSYGKIVSSLPSQNIKSESNRLRLLPYAFGYLSKNDLSGFTN